MPTNLLRTLDNWLKKAMQLGQETHGHAWMNVYFQTPIHGFIWNKNTLPSAANTWMVGVIMPSVDNAGRAFPFVLLEQLPMHTQDGLNLESLSQWFSQAHSLCAKALNQEWNLTQVEQAVQGISELDNTLPNGQQFAIPITLSKGQSQWFRIGFEGSSNWVMQCKGLPNSHAFEALLGLRAAA